MRDYSLNLWNGLATLTISIPSDAEIDDILCFRVEISDINQVNPFSSKFCIQVFKEQKNGNSNGNRKNPPSDKAGKDRQKESYLDLPNIMEIRKEDWDKEDYKDFNFDQNSALKVRSTGEENGYDFFINMDNVCLKTEMKGSAKIEPALLEARYRYGMVLLGISILDFEENRQKKKKEGVESDKNGLSIYDKISLFTEAISPALLPMITSLGSSEFEI